MIFVLEFKYDEKILKLLINKKSDLTQKNDKGESALILLLKNYSLEFVKEIFCFFKFTNFNPMEIIDNHFDIFKFKFIFKDLFNWKKDSFLLWKIRFNKQKYWEIFYY